MTNEEIIKQLKDIEKSFSEIYFKGWRQAIDLAIKALEQQQSYEEAFEEMRGLSQVWEEGVGIKKCIDIIKKHLEDQK